MMKMNNKGQILVVFVIILPLMLLCATVFIKKSYIYYEKTKMDNILKLACKSSNPLEIIKNNDSKIESEIAYENNTLVINAKKKINDDTIKIKKICKE